MQSGPQLQGLSSRSGRRAEFEPLIVCVPEELSTGTLEIEYWLRHLAPPVFEYNERFTFRLWMLIHGHDDLRLRILMWLAYRLQW